MLVNGSDLSEALTDDAGHSLTFGELRAAADRLYAHVGGRCLIFILASNTLGSVAGYVSCLENHVVPAMLSSRLDPDLLTALVSRYRPRFLWAPSDQPPVPGVSCEAVYSDLGYALFATGFQEKPEIYPDLALLLSTSGSTGTPRFVRQSYANIESNTAAIAGYLGITPSDRAVTTLPMHYTYGLSVINTHLYSGAAILLTEHSLVQKEFWQFVREHQATSLAGVPYTYSILDRIRFCRMDLPELRTLTQAGGRLSPQLQEKFATWTAASGRRFFVMYGQCEATARMSYLPPEMAAVKTGSIGIPVPGGRFLLVDPQGKEINTPDTRGELVYMGPNVTLGYAEGPGDLAKGDERCGRLLTGDMAHFDRDGYFYVTGRKSRFIKIYGNRVNLDELESLVRSRFRLECACAGEDDCLDIFMTDPDSIPGSEIVSYVSGITGLNPAAFRIRIIPRIPRNEAGKIQYGELRDLYEL